jgi:hypothetical protein
MPDKFGEQLQSIKGAHANFVVIQAKLVGDLAGKRQ